MRFRRLNSGKRVRRRAAGRQGDQQILRTNVMRQDIPGGLFAIILNTANHIFERGNTAGKKNNHAVLRNAECAGQFQRISQSHQAGRTGGSIKQATAAAHDLGSSTGQPGNGRKACAQRIGGSNLTIQKQAKRLDRIALVDPDGSWVTAFGLRRHQFCLQDELMPKKYHFASLNLEIC